MCKDDEEEKLQWENKGIEKNEKIAVKERAGGEKDLQSKKVTKGEKKKVEWRWEEGEEQWIWVKANQNWAQQTWPNEDCVSVKCFLSSLNYCCVPQQGFLTPLLNLTTFFFTVTFKRPV